jgi:Acyltransferase
VLSLRDRIALNVQRLVSQALAPLSYYGAVAWLLLGRGYRIPGLARCRRRYRLFLEEGGGPVVICANHLTKIDSLLIMWALSPGWKWWFRPVLMPWNLPDKANFSGNAWIRMACYFGRCLPIIRRGPREEVRRVLEKVNVVLERGHAVLIFPEGGRSRLGRVDTDNFGYGVGTILQECPQARVLCVFLRGEKQREYSDLPQAGDRFHIDLRALHPKTENSGLRGARDLSTQIVQTLAGMEQDYFRVLANAVGE